MGEVLEDRRFGIRLGETIDLDDRVGGWLGVDGDGNGHLQIKAGYNSLSRAGPGVQGRMSLPLSLSCACEDIERRWDRRKSVVK